MLKNCVLVTILGVPAMAHAQAWKCQIDGKTVFSDVPCKGTFIDTSKLNGNTVAPVKAPPPPPRQVREEFATAPMGGIVDSRNRARAGCPTPAEVRDLETSASSNNMGAEAREGLKKAQQRAEWCRQGLNPAEMAAKQRALDAEEKRIRAIVQKELPIRR